MIWSGILHRLYSGIPTSWGYHDMLPYLSDSNAVLSIGGDNYSLDYGVPKRFTDLDDFVNKRSKPIILWGVSVGPFTAMPRYEQYMSDHLRKVTGIFARESITISYLNNIGVKKNIHSSADPAFLLDPVKPNGIDDLVPMNKDAIGINLSPLMAKYITSGDQEQWIKLSSQIIQTIALKTEIPVYLIPHVTETGTNNNDYIFMKKVLSLIHENKNIVLIPPIFNAAETKWIISRMTIFAGARTHSTIAALSSCVPTLSFAYSIKAQGINRDIFNHADYCLDPKDINVNGIYSLVTSMLNQHTSIKKELEERIPMVQRKAMNAGMMLKQIIGEC